MTRYGPRDLRLASRFGVGLMLLGVGILVTTLLAGRRISDLHGSLIATAFFAVGVALRLKVRQLQRSGGSEPDERDETDSPTGG